MNAFMPALQVPIDGIFLGDIFGLILAIPIALFLAFWMSAVKNRAAVVFGSFLFALIGFVIILGWVGTLVYNTPLPNANGGAVFFGSLLFCTIMGVAGGFLTDLVVARLSRRDYRRQTAHE